MTKDISTWEDREKKFQEIYGPHAEYDEEFDEYILGLVAVARAQERARIRERIEETIESLEKLDTAAQVELNAQIDAVWILKALLQALQEEGGDE